MIRRSPRRAHADIAENSDLRCGSPGGRPAALTRPASARQRDLDPAVRRPAPGSSGSAGRGSAGAPRPSCPAARASARGPAATRSGGSGHRGRGRPSSASGPVRPSHRSNRPSWSGQATTQPSSPPIDSGADMCGQRSSIATMPSRRVGQQDVEVADGDAPHRARRQVIGRQERARRPPVRCRGARSLGRKSGDAKSGSGRPGAMRRARMPRPRAWAEVRGVGESEERGSGAGGRLPRRAAAAGGRLRVRERPAERQLPHHESGDDRETYAPTREHERLTDAERECVVERRVELADERLEDLLTPAAASARTALTIASMIAAPKLWPTPVWLFRSRPAAPRCAWSWSIWGWNARGAAGLIEANTGPCCAAAGP